jgi:SWI/SNF-related matrix-associated actin-dependent regulator of chromatin subfamily A member 5
MEDYICAIGLYRYGYGFWELIRNDIRNEPTLIFDWTARSRTAADIHRRCDLLLTHFEKECDPEMDSKKKKLAKKGPVKKKDFKPIESKKALGKRQREDESSQDSKFEQDEETAKTGRGRPKRVVAK